VVITRLLGIVRQWNRLVKLLECYALLIIAERKGLIKRATHLKLSQSFFQVSTIFFEMHS